MFLLISKPELAALLILIFLCGLFLFGICASMWLIVQKIKKGKK